MRHRCCCQGKSGWLVALRWLSKQGAHLRNRRGEVSLSHLLTHCDNRHYSARVSYCWEVQASPGTLSARISQEECPNPQNGTMNPCLSGWRHESSETTMTHPFSVVDGTANRKMSASHTFLKTLNGWYPAKLWGGPSYHPLALEHPAPNF